MKRVIVVGSGAGGAAIANTLKENFEVTVLEEGKAFKPFSYNLAMLEKLRKTRMFVDEREIQLLFAAMRIRRTEDHMIMVNGSGLGGTTTLSAGNALRMDAGLKKLGINLDKEFEELYQEIPITTDHQNIWRDTTKRLYEICEEMGLDPQPLPKFGDYKKCKNCGRCVLGCPYGVKWDSRNFLIAATPSKIRLETGCKVLKVIMEQNVVTGVEARKGRKIVFYPADVVVIAAGGFATPVILNNSGIDCEDRLSVDPVLCVFARKKGSLQNKELSMPFVVKREHYIISPYFDWLSFFFHRKLNFPASEVLSLMIKLADTSRGSVDEKNIHKTLSSIDKERLGEAVELCKDILERDGIERKSIFLGTINAGHPGGMLPLTSKEAQNLHPSRLPRNLYVADATLLPESIGNPPILTIMALAKKIGKIISEEFK